MRIKAKVVLLVLLAFILGACDSKECKNGEDCFKQAQIYWDKKEFQKSFELYKKACELKSIGACWRMQEIYLYDFEVLNITKDEQKANEYHQKAFEFAKEACQEDDGEACYILGRKYNDYFSDEELLELLTKACKLEVGRACLSEKFAKEGQEYFEKGFELINKACKKNSWNDCWLVGTIYDNGSKIKRDITTARKFYQKALKLAQKECLAGDYYQACFALGTFYEDGFGVEKNFKKAKEYYEKSCNVGNSMGCKLKSIMENIIKNL